MDGSCLRMLSFGSFWWGLQVSLIAGGWAQEDQHSGTENLRKDDPKTCICPRCVLYFIQFKYIFRVFWLFVRFLEHSALFQHIYIHRKPIQWESRLFWFCGSSKLWPSQHTRCQEQATPVPKQHLQKPMAVTLRVWRCDLISGRCRKWWPFLGVEKFSFWDPSGGKCHIS